MMRKVLVIGCPGSGKSTFSTALHQITDLPLVHLDMLYWNADKTIVEKPVFRERLTHALAQDTWIIDGNYASTMELRMQHCDTVIFLDYPTELCLEGILSRCGKLRPDMPWTEPQQEPDAEFVETVKTYTQRHRPVVLALLDKYADKTIHIFRSRQEADAFLSDLRQDIRLIPRIY